MQDPANLLAPAPGLMPVTLVVLGLMVAVPLSVIVHFWRAYVRRSKDVVGAPSQAASIAALEDDVTALRAVVAHLTDAQAFTTPLRDTRPAVEPRVVRDDAVTRNDEGRQT